MNNLLLDLNLNEATKSSKSEDFEEELLMDKFSIKKEKIKLILSSPFDERTEDQINSISSYILNISNISQKFSFDNIDEKDYKEIIMSSANTCQYKLIKNMNEMIYNINDEANFFYIILKGSVKISNLIKVSKEMNGHNYYDKLLNYRNNKEYYLLKKTIDENYHLFPVDYNDMKIIDKIMIKLNIMKLDSDNDPNLDPDYLEYLLKYYGSSLAEYRLETYRELLRKKNEKTIIYNNLLIQQKKEDKIKPLLEYNIYNAKLHSLKNRNLLKNQLKYISPETCRRYYFFMNENKENLAYYELVEDKKIRNTNNYFGDFENNKYIQRAISNSENLELLKMNNDIYKDFIKREKAKIIDAQVSFFLNNFFFDKITKEHFIRYYFSFFEAVSFTLNQKIISQDEKVDYIYFIKSGVVKLISNRSILENYIIIDLIKSISRKDESSEISEEENNKLNIKDYTFEGDVRLLKKELNIKHKSHLITYSTNQALGYECFYYGINYLYTAIAESREVNLYRIKIKPLLEILKDKGDASHKQLVKKSKNKMKLLLERFTLINNDIMKFYDKKLIYRKNKIVLKSKTNKGNKEIRKVKNIRENFQIILSEENNTKNEKDNFKNISFNNDGETERKNFIKKLFENRIINRKISQKNIIEDNKVKSSDNFRKNKRQLSYMNFFEQKTVYPKINKYQPKYSLSHDKIDFSNYLNSNLNSNLNTNYTNAIKENKSNNNLKQAISQKHLFNSKYYFFSDNFNNNDNNRNTLDRTLLMNKKLLSNIFCTFSTRKKLSNDEIKKKLEIQKPNKYSTLKNFRNILLKHFSLHKYDISYKYDFRRDLDNNLKLLKYSLFNFPNTPRTNNKDSSFQLCIVNKNIKKIKSKK